MERKRKDRNCNPSAVSQKDIAIDIITIVSLYHHESGLVNSWLKLKVKVKPIAEQKAVQVEIDMKGKEEKEHGSYACAIFIVHCSYWNMMHIGMHMLYQINR